MTLVVDNPVSEPVVEPVEVQTNLDGLVPDELVIVVTYDDIKNGISGNSMKCAIALSAQRTTGVTCHMGGYLFVYQYDDESIRIADKYENIEAGRWAEQFDHDKSLVAPERFVFRRIR